MPTNKRSEVSVIESDERKVVTKCRKLVVITSVDNSNMLRARAVIPQLWLVFAQPPPCQKSLGP